MPSLSLDIGSFIASLARAGDQNLVPSLSSIQVWQKLRNSDTVLGISFASCLHDKIQHEQRGHSHSPRLEL
jgi:hypothetical protein